MSEDDRIFTKLVYLGKNDTEWPECTDADKRKWEEDHPEPEPEPEGEQLAEQRHTARARRTLWRTSLHCAWLSS